MKFSNIKGALLEYIVRNLLKNCGFTNIKSDNLYSFEKMGLFFVNGKGAAHDCDIIMNPPIQMPFHYPTQLIFECKAYGTTANLTIVRNALGLRNDLNDFEVISKESLLKRQNNRRSTYSIETRTRFFFQVGVASVNNFSKPAIEFATNNKIPLLSLDWFLGPRTIADFNNIDQSFIDSISKEDIKNVYDFFKDREGNLSSPIYRRAENIFNSNNILGDIVTTANATIKYCFVGLLETGDVIFLFASSRPTHNLLNQSRTISGFKAEIHWFNDSPKIWQLTVYDSLHPEQRSNYDFFIPQRIFSHWAQFNLNKLDALNIKENYFSKIFVFNKNKNPEIPFSIINIDRPWLENAIEKMKNHNTE